MKVRFEDPGVASCQTVARWQEEMRRIDDTGDGTKGLENADGDLPSKPKLSRDQSRGFVLREKRWPEQRWRGIKCGEGELRCKREVDLKRPTDA